MGSAGDPGRNDLVLQGGELVQAIYGNRFEDEARRKLLWRVLVERFFQRYVDESDTVLDVASGYAEFINNIRCRRKYAIDINPSSVGKVASDVKFISAASTDIPLAAKSVDKVWVSNFFEHISRPDIERTIAEFGRVLRPGGEVLVLQPNIRFAARNYWMFWDHVTPIDDRALIEVFSVFGFQVRERIERFLPYTAKSRLPVTAGLVRAYLTLRPVWRLLGQQTFLRLTASG